MTNAVQSNVLGHGMPDFELPGRIFTMLNLSCITNWLTDQGHGAETLLVLVRPLVQV